MICHDYKCTFVHIPKTAGQSVEHFFLDLYGLTWDERAPLLLRSKKELEEGPPRLAHLKAAEYTAYNYMTPEQFKLYFKFAFVRNPWDRMVSFYKYSGYSQLYDFPYFVKHKFVRKLWKERYWFVCPQFEFVFDDKENLLVDFLGRFEFLQEDFSKVCQKLDLPDGRLKHVNKSTPQDIEAEFTIKSILNYFRWLYFKNKRPDFKDFRDYYDKESRQFVAELYHRDIQAFGYSFD